MPTPRLYSSERFIEAGPHYPQAGQEARLREVTSHVWLHPLVSKAQVFSAASMGSVCVWGSWEGSSCQKRSGVGFCV